MEFHQFFCTEISANYGTSDGNTNKFGISIRSATFFLKSGVFGVTHDLSNTEH
jgi:hypothetical protein